VSAVGLQLRAAAKKDPEAVDAAKITVPNREVVAVPGEAGARGKERTSVAG
jgi:hypothetical protein